MIDAKGDSKGGAKRTAEEAVAESVPWSQAQVRMMKNDAHVSAIIDLWNHINRLSLSTR